CFAADPATCQIANRGHDVAVDHRHLRRRRYQNTRLKLHSTLLLRGSELVSRGGQYHCRSTVHGGCDAGSTITGTFRNSKRPRIICLIIPVLTVAAPPARSFARPLAAGTATLNLAASASLSTEIFAPVSTNHITECPFTDIGTCTPSSLTSHLIVASP